MKIARKRPGPRTKEAQPEERRAPKTKAIDVPPITMPEPALHNKPARDISAREHAEDQVSLFRTLLDYSSDAIEVIDPATGRFLDVNATECRMLGYSREELLSMTVFDVTPNRLRKDFRQSIERLRKQDSVIFETTHRKKDGKVFPVEINARLVRLDREYVLSMARDITARKQAEESLRQSEMRFRAVIENSWEGITLVDRNNKVVYASPANERIIGYTQEERTGRTSTELIHPDDASQVVEYLRKAGSRSGAVVHIEYRTHAKNGEWKWIEGIAHNLLEEPDIQAIVVNFRDVSERKQAEEALKASEARWRAIFDQAGVGIALVDNTGRTVQTNLALQNMLQYTAEELNKLSFTEFTHPDDISTELVLRQELEKGDRVKYQIEKRYIRKDGEIIWVNLTVTALRDNQGNLQFGLGMAEDITQRKRAEEELRESEERFRSLSQAAFEGIMFHENGVIQDANQVFAELVGLHSPDDLIGKYGLDVLPFTPESVELLRQSLQSDTKDLLEIAVVRPDGSTFPVETQGSSITIKGREVRVVAMRDITARKQAESALQEARSFLQLVVDSSPSMIFVTNAQGQLVFANKYIADYYGTTPQALLAQSTGYVHTLEREARGFVHDDQEVIRTRRTIVKDELNTDPNGKQHWFHTVKVPLIKPDGSAQSLGIATDITDRQQAEEKIQRQLEHLTALSEIDRSITSSFDVRQSLETLLSHACLQLNVNAADVLLYDSEAQMLETIAEQGFHTRAIAKAPMHIGQGYASQVMRERRMLVIPNLKDYAPDALRATFFTKENFVSYYAVPLIAKGQIRGVLEIFQRSLLEPDKDWVDFLNALSEQAAIAIENSTLFSNLQRSNSELSMAYDATIEGWSRALDLRDRETEGHTRRVTNLTIQLGRAFQLSETELVQVRWGALLHDIGKMGVPDGVLFKPGPLTEQEWVIMKKHPVLAYEMLAPIRHLRAALDIPYLHHEKWNGTGYPLGLRDEQIPLAARIFAVADVWDALRSDRPYRSAWSAEKVREYIRSLSAAHFDPRVVQVFLESDIPGGEQSSG